MANTGTINVDLTATTSTFTANLAKARSDLASNAAAMNKSLVGMEKSFGNIKEGATKMGEGLLSAQGSFAGLFEVVGVGFLAEFVHKTIETGAAMVDMATRIGISTDELQGMAYAAKLAGLSSEDLERNLIKLNRTIADTGAGSKTILTELNIKPRDNSGAYRPMLDVMLELADRYERAGSSAAKTKILVDAFGKSGAQMAPLFEQGAEGIKAAVDEANALGIVIDASLLRGAKSASDAMLRLSAVVDANVSKSILTLAPQIESLANHLVSLAGALSEFTNTWSDFFGNNESNSASYLAEQIAQTQEYIRVLKTMTQGNILSGFNIVDDALAQLEGRVKLLRAAEEDAMELANFNVPRIPPRTNDDFSTPKKDGLADYIASLREEVQLAQTDGEAHEVLAAMLRAEHLARDQNIKLGPAEKQTITAYVQLIKEYNDKTAEKKKLEQDGKQLTESLLTPQEKYNEDIADYTKLLAAGAITQETYNRALAASKKTLDELTEGYKQASEFAGDLTQALQSAWDSGSQGGVKATKIVEDLINALSQAIIKAYILGPLLKALGDEFKSSASGGGGFLGSIFSSIGSLFGSSSSGSVLPGGVGAQPYAGGGGFEVGGSGAIDSKLFGLRLTPGEKVNIQRPGAPMGGGGIVSVIVNNNASGTKASASQSTDANGQEQIIVQIEQEMAKRVSKTGSPLNKAISNTFNTQQVLAKR